MKLYVVIRYVELGEQIVAICSTEEKAKLYLDMPNYDLGIAEYELDNDDYFRIVVA